MYTCLKYNVLHVYVWRTHMAWKRVLFFEFLHSTQKLKILFNAIIVVVVIVKLKKYERSVSVYHTVIESLNLTK